MNTPPTQCSLNRAACKGRVISPRGLFGFLALSLGLLPLGFAVGDEPLPVCALPAVSAEGLTLLLDPVEHAPIALLSDPDARLPVNRWPVVLQTVWDNPDATGLPRLRLADALPEFWAQPAVWVPFLRGPAAYSGLGTEVRARDWAGLPATDRRSYRLDPGLRSAPTLASVAPPGGGLIRLQGNAASLRLAWNGGPGRVYQVHYATNLSGPFQVMQTLIASEDGDVQVALPTAGSQGFYRLAEIAP
jgi:hypothetical protein